MPPVLYGGITMTEKKKDPVTVVKESVTVTEKKKEANEIFDDFAYDRAMQYGDKHDVAIEKGWGKIPEGKSEDVVLIEE